MSLSVIKEAMSVLDTISRLPTGAITFTNAIMSIFYVLSVILTTNGAEGWHQKVNEAMGENTLNPDDERNLQPIVQLLLQIRDSKATESLESLFKQQGGFKNPIDTAYNTIVDYNKGISDRVTQFFDTTGMGIIQYQNYMDTRPDPRPFKKLQAVKPIGPFIAPIPTPIRLTVFLVHSALDIVRIMTSGSPIMRQLLSVALAIIELLKGDWKKSLLSFSGFFSKSMVLTGFVGKIFLELFSLISPSLQESIVSGGLRVTKSILLGFLLQVFKITAPEPIRITIATLIKKLASVQERLDGVLEKVGIPAGVGDLIDNPARNCSTDFFQIAMQAAEKSTIMSVILQLANIPTTKEDLKWQCSKFYAYTKANGYVTWKDLLAAEGILHMTDEEIAAETALEEEVNEGEIPEELKENPEIQEYLKELEDLRKRIPIIIKEREDAEEKMKNLLKGASEKIQDNKEKTTPSASESPAPSAPESPAPSTSESPAPSAPELPAPSAPESPTTESPAPSAIESPALSTTESPTTELPTTESPATESPAPKPPAPKSPAPKPSSAPSLTPLPPQPPSLPTRVQKPGIPSGSSKNKRLPLRRKGGYADYSYSESD